MYDETNKIYKNKITNETFLIIDYNNFVSLFSCLDHSGKNDITITKEKFLVEYEFLKLEEV